MPSIDTTAAPSQAPAAKIRFVVINDCMFGYIDPRQPLQAGILMSKPQRGAHHFWQDGPFPIRGDGKDLRPATLADFDDYRIGRQYHADPEHYELPTA
jgi:hypothetical protein